MGLLTEADTCRKYVVPKLYAAGWDDEKISEQRSFTDGRIVLTGNKRGSEEVFVAETNSSSVLPMKLSACSFPGNEQIEIAI